MGRTAGRKRLPLAVLTTSELVRAVAGDFAQQQMERSARQLVRRPGERLAELDDHHRALRAEWDAALQTPKRDAVVAHMRRLALALKRPRRQPPKYPQLDAAMLKAVQRGESPVLVVTAALAALRLAQPEIRSTPAMRRRFLDRLKKNRRR